MGGRREPSASKRPLAGDCCCCFVLGVLCARLDLLPARNLDKKSTIAVRYEQIERARPNARPIMPPPKRKFVRSIVILPGVRRCPRTRRSFSIIFGYCPAREARSEHRVCRQ